MVSCGKKGAPIKSEPIPLLRDKYLSEYRTELERAKVRKNLGIKDNQKIAWGQLEGTIEEQTDLITYVESKWHYNTDLDQDIHTVSEALDYVIAYVKTFKSEAGDVAKLFQETEAIRTNLTRLEDNLSDGIQTNAEAIEALELNVQGINKSIEVLNQKLLTINVDKNILEWMKNAQSNSIILTEANKVETKLSTQELNAVKVLDTPEVEGLYVKDLEPNVTSLEEKSTAHESSITQLTTDVEQANTYHTELAEDTVSPDKIGGIDSGTSVKDLKGKTITQILDFILFPTYVRDLIQPEVYYSEYSQVIEINDPVLTPTLNYVQGDAGAENQRTESIEFRGQTVEITNYNQLGIYTHKGTISYDAGEYLIDNKGQTTDKRIEAGSQSASFTVTTTYPWYAGNTESAEKQTLVAFGLSNESQLSLTGQAMIKLPGNGSTIESFTVDAGMGYLDVDLDGWTQSTELIKNYPYKVWKKKDSYLGNLPHKITFKLSE